MGTRGKSFFLLFEQGYPYFHFAQDSTNYIASIMGEKNEVSHLERPKQKVKERRQPVLKPLVPAVPEAQVL